MLSTSEFNAKIKEELGEIDRWIVENEFIISGSFVVSMIRDDFYEDSDIDIYVNYPFVLKDKDNVKSEFEEWIVEKLGGVLQQSSYSFVDKRSRKYIIRNGRDINIINVPGETKEGLKDYVRKISDLDICTCSYDGYSVDFNISVITGFAKEINKRTDNFFSDKFKKDYDFKRKLRIMKYFRRGFYIKTDYIFSAKFFIKESNYLNKQRRNREIMIQRLDNIAKLVESGEYRITERRGTLYRRILKEYGSVLEKCKNNENQYKWTKIWYEISQKNL